LHELQAQESQLEQPQAVQSQGAILDVVLLVVLGLVF